jgi:hypothetical protein
MIVVTKGWPRESREIESPSALWGREPTQYRPGFSDGGRLRTRAGGKESTSKK